MASLVLAGCLSKPDRPAVLDAADDRCEPVACGAAGGTCIGGVCVIERGTTAFVTCPAAMPCRIACSGKDACKMGASCGAATTCEVRCDGESACVERGVDCGTAATCDVRCFGQAACEHQVSGATASVECRNAACTVECRGDAACKAGIAVAGGTCEATCCNGACEGPTGACVVDRTCP
ncbi:MAG: hypothetical protein H0T89_02510 [Deltaproteobacteria bacterium]|nr:hypothetical protein [Deltaproteobacteria bacterium]